MLCYLYFSSKSGSPLSTIWVVESGANRRHVIITTLLNTCLIQPVQGLIYRCKTPSIQLTTPSNPCMPYCLWHFQLRWTYMYGTTRNETICLLHLSEYGLSLSQSINQSINQSVNQFELDFWNVLLFRSSWSRSVCVQRGPPVGRTSVVKRPVVGRLDQLCCF